MAMKYAPQCVIDKPENSLSACGDVNQLRVMMGGERLRRGKSDERQLCSVEPDDTNCVAQTLATSGQYVNAVHVKPAKDQN
jgi:hypothetical protein